MTTKNMQIPITVSLTHDEVVALGWANGHAGFATPEEIQAYIASAVTVPVAAALDRWAEAVHPNVNNVRA